MVIYYHKSYCLSIIRGTPRDHGRSVPPDPGDGADRPHQSQAEEEHRHGAEQAAAGQAGAVDGEGGGEGDGSAVEGGEELFPECGADCCQGKGSIAVTSSR